MDTKYKCGEIYVTNTGKYFFLCLLCDKFFDTINANQQHSLEEHFEFDQHFDEITSSHSEETITMKKLYSFYDDECPTSGFHTKIDPNVDNNSVKLEDYPPQESYNIEQDDFESDSSSLNHDHHDQDNSEKCTNCKKMHSQYSEEKCMEIQNKILDRYNDISAMEAEGNFFCKYCCTSFSEKEELMTHVKKHKDPGNCFVCDKVSANVREHTKKHHLEFYCEYYDQYSAQCKYCNKHFSKETTLKKHELAHENKDLNCKFCGKIFLENHSLNRHLKIHDVERPYKCEYCSAGFTELHNLRTHRISRHTNDFNFPCGYDDCKQLFKTKELRKRHIKYIHLKERNYQCEDCGSSFGTSGLLNFHRKKTHMNYDDRPYPCEYCDKKYVQMAELKEHLYVHTGEKHHRCNYNRCGKTFSNRSILSKHRKTHLK